MAAVTRLDRAKHGVALLVAGEERGEVEAGVAGSAMQVTASPGSRGGEVMPGVLVGVVSAPSTRCGGPADTSQTRRRGFGLSLQRLLHGQAERLGVDEAAEHGTVVPRGGAGEGNVEARRSAWLRRGAGEGARGHERGEGFDG
jgi:hypothetical protein